mmetsp:Transcript_8691/g.15018  ORF Transcript_8691/g.15018 Transcript_8691/m.15018 type:complete len:307 (+) Transcript_8691:93-1013(+)
MGLSGTDLQEEIGTWTNRRGQVLHTHKLVPNRKCRGVLLQHHGFSEHSGRHLKFLRELAIRVGLVVVTFDCHGHGLSQPASPERRGYVGQWQHLQDDLLDIVDQVAVPAAEARGVPPNRIFLSGHSMGGMTALLAELERPGYFAGLILIAPLVTVTPKGSMGEWAQILVLRLLNIFIPAVPFLKRKAVTVGIRDPAAVIALMNDPLWIREPIKVRTVVSCINATLVIQRRSQRVTDPMLVLQGTHDKTCSVIGIRRLLPTFGSRDVFYHEVQDATHDLLHDLETPSIVDKMSEWLEEKVSLLELNM